MKLRVPDYYSEFSCIADKCKDSCCIGWEIDIDEDTHEYYNFVEGEFGDRLRENMYMTEDGDHSFKLKKHGRCPFLNSKNLCDICIELGEEALSEVCTEYPRFAIEYEDVLQKCLSLSCEEVGRILFTREEPVKFVEMELSDCEMNEDMQTDPNNGEDVVFECEYETEIRSDEYYDSEYEYAVSPKFMEEVQENLIDILQDRNVSIWKRIINYLKFAELIQDTINTDSEPQSMEHYREKVTKAESELSDYSSKKIFAGFSSIFSIFEDMETLDIEWDNAKKEMLQVFQNNEYGDILQDFLQSKDMFEKDYEHLMVYFTFRYMMNAVYDSNVISYAKLAIVFTLMIRDMDAVRFHLNGGSFSIHDRIDVARIFSKEVEHSQENVEHAREELMFANF